jgi:acetylglutamate kinase
VKTIDYGFVGDVDCADGEMLSRLIEQGITPIVAPLTHDGKGTILNTNADTMAGETAKALAQYFDVTLVYCFEKEGVLRDENDDNSVIPAIDRELYATLKEEGIVVGGMIPKLDNSFATLDAGVKEVIITKASNLCDLTRGTHIIG